MTTDPRYDVLVVGGGPAGVVAAVQAARAGARTLLVEKNGMLGGTTTSAGVNFPGLFHAWGRQVIAGIGWEWVTRAAREAGSALPDFAEWRGKRHWQMQVLVNIPVYAAVADALVGEAGCRLLLHTLVARVESHAEDWEVALCGKEGLHTIRAKVLVDCTGDANIAGLAGCKRLRNAALQPGTLAMRAEGYDLDKLDLEALEQSFRAAVERGEMLRSDFQAAENPVASFLHKHGDNAIHVPNVDASTSRGRTGAELAARAVLLRIVRFFRAQPGLGEFRIERCAAECGIRETVTIDGEKRITRDDYVSGRVWPDSLCYSFYPIDIHATGGQGGIDTRYLQEGVFPTIPLGAQLPKGSRRLLVAGRCAAGDQEANSAYRVQASAMAMGQVAGAVAALAAGSGRELRELPLAEARALLRRHGAIVPEPPEQLAVTHTANAGEGIPTDAPSGLLCDLLAHPERTQIRAQRPTFGWMVNGGRTGSPQAAFQIRVGSAPGELAESADCWDSGRVESAESLNIEYAGVPLQPGQAYWWSARTWGTNGRASAWAPPQRFVIAGPLSDGAGKEERGEVSAYPLELREETATVRQTGARTWSAAFSQVAFGWLELDVESPDDGALLKVCLGESAKDGLPDSEPPGSVRYAESQLRVKAGRRRYRIETPVDARNTGPHAIHLPGKFGAVLPFRYVCVEALDDGDKIVVHGARRQSVEYPFEEGAAAFHSSDRRLNEVWALCHHTIRATSFAGFYVDGDRERIPYEADAYINQLSHYAADREFSLARRTHEYLLEYPTWPTEWKQHSILIAWADYEATGDGRSLRRHYETLKNTKLLLEFAREDGLLATGHRQPGQAVDQGDIVDWPVVERDGFDFCEVNTVVNAFHYRTLRLMAKIASALGKEADARDFSERAERVCIRFNERLFDEARGVYVDGEGSARVSQHANLFALAMGVVSEERKASVSAYVKSRGMACSVYPAQYLLEGLFEAREAEHAIALMTADGLRSWSNMLAHGATLTWEAWDQSLKPNQDWNHAWATAPLNIIARYVLGVRPLEPGYGRIVIDPQPGNLDRVEGTVPSIRGPIHVSVWREAGGQWSGRFRAPANVQIELRDNNPVRWLTALAQ